MTKANSFVRIKKIILNPNERTANIPDETKKVPLICFMKGYLIEDANIGDIVKIKTITNRIESGELIEVQPTFMHNYGNFVEELNLIYPSILKVMENNDER